MRIPFLVAIPACLLTIFVIWWVGTRDMDFLAPPSEARLQEIRSEALAALPVSTMQDDAISVRVPLPQPDPTLPEPAELITPVDLGDLTSPPVLDTYSDRAPDGAARLLALAVALENRGAFQRALLACERVLDLSQSNPEQIQTATSAIEILKPTLPLWNTDPTTALPITIHVGTGEKFSEILPAILDEISVDLENASSGLLRFSHKLNIGRSIQTEDAPTPVAAWITGGGEDAPSTDVLSFTTNDPEALRNDLLKTVFNLVRSHLSKSTAYTLLRRSWASRSPPWKQTSPGSSGRNSESCSTPTATSADSDQIRLFFSKFDILDSLTQATLGAAVGEAVLGKKLGNSAILWGALFGTLPDLDVIASPLLDTARKLEFHRGASHSLLFMVLASFLLARPLAKLWKKQKISPARAGTFIFLVWFTHVLIDCFTVYGTSVLWPFSETRVAFNHMFIIDPLYTLPLLVSLVWLAFYRTKKQWKKRVRIRCWGLGLSTAYVAFTIGMKFLASAAFDADLARRDVTYIRRMEAPTAFNSLLWRSVVDRGDELWVGYHSVFDGKSAPIRWTIYPKQKEAIEPFADEREVKTLLWFSRGWWIARPHAKGVWLADLRFGETRTYDAKPGMVDSQFMFSWSFRPAAERDRLRTVRPEVRDPKDSLKRILARIVGKKQRWEANPRLAGIRGSLPEFLSVAPD